MPWTRAVAAIQSPHVLHAWQHPQPVDEAPLPSRESLVVLDAEQHVSRDATVGDEDRTCGRGLPGAAGVLVETWLGF